MQSHYNYKTAWYIIITLKFEGCHNANYFMGHNCLFPVDNNRHNSCKAIKCIGQSLSSQKLKKHFRFTP